MELCGSLSIKRKTKTDFTPKTFITRCNGGKVVRCIHVCVCPRMYVHAFVCACVCECGVRMLHAYMYIYSLIDAWCIFFVCA